MSISSVQDQQNVVGPGDRFAFIGKGTNVEERQPEIDSTSRDLGLPPLIEMIVRCCVTFSTMDEHLRVVQRTLNLPQEKAALVKEVLQEFLNRGLLVTERQLFGGIKPRLRNAGAITTLAIPSRAGSQLLPHAVRSYSLHMSEFGRKHRILVSEDGPGESDMRSRWTSVEACHPEVELQFLGVEQKCELAKHLIDRSGAPAEVVNFAIFGSGLQGSTYGANRNAILLATTGECIFTGDDDTLCVPLTIDRGGQPEVLALAG